MILLALALLAGASPPRATHLNQQQLDEISDRCLAPREWLRNVRGEVRLRPSPGAKYGQVDCVLAELRRRHVGSYRMLDNPAPMGSARHK